MEPVRHLSRFDRIMPRSTFGVTLLTITITILVIGFFAHGLQLMSVDGVPEGYVRLTQRQPPLSQNGSNRGNSDKRSRAEDRSDDMDLSGIARVKPSERYGSNRSAVASLVAPGYVAALIRTCDCRWANNEETPPEGTQFRVGHTLNLAAGLVEIAFACGAKAIIEGPAVLELQSEKSGALRSGRLTADVPDDLEGFKIHTPVAQVVSLSTAQREKVAKVTGTADCQWAKGSAVSREGASLKVGQTVKLAGGLAEITFACGAKVILQGPANFEIESDKTAILHSGRLTADVPDDLEGFKIHTPVAEILSLPADSPSPPAKATNKDSVKSAVDLKPGAAKIKKAPAETAPAKSEKGAEPEQPAPAKKPADSAKSDAKPASPSKPAK